MGNCVFFWFFISFNSSHDFINVISVLSTFPAVTCARDAAPGEPGYCQRALTNFPYLLRLYARVGSIPDLGSLVWCGGSMNPPFVMPLSSHDLFFRQTNWDFFPDIFSMKKSWWQFFVLPISIQNFPKIPKIILRKLYDEAWHWFWTLQLSCWVIFGKFGGNHEMLS